MDAARQVLHRRDFAAGMPATEGTVKWIGDLVRAAAVDARIRQRARQLTAQLRPFDHDGEIAAVWQHVLEHVRYLRDPEGVEYITDPVELDRQVDEGTAAEDCEGMIAYALALLASMGIPSLIAAHGFNPREPQRFSHCAAVVGNPRTKQAIWFDPVGALEFPDTFNLGDTVYRPGNPVALWDLYGKRVAMVNPVNLDEIFDSPARGPYTSLRGVAFGDVDYAQVARGVADSVKTIAPAFGPYGMLAAGLIQVGESVYDLATGEHVGNAIGQPRVIPPPPPSPTPVKMEPVKTQVPPLAQRPALRMRMRMPVDQVGGGNKQTSSTPSSGGAGKVVGVGLALAAARALSLI